MRRVDYPQHIVDLCDINVILNRANLSVHSPQLAVYHVDDVIKITCVLSVRRSSFSSCRKCFPVFLKGFLLVVQGLQFCFQSIDKVWDGFGVYALGCI